MTRYDPFAYGSVRLDPKQPKGEPDAEEVLFGSVEPVSPPPDDSSWSLLEEDIDGLLPTGAPPPADDFAPSLLGEEMPAAAPPRPVERPPAETFEPAGEMQAGPASGERREVRRRPLAAREPAAATPAAKRPRRQALPGRRRRPIAAALFPLILCAVGGTSASWFWVMQNNPVMAGILGVTTMVAALFAWLLLRG